MGGVQKRTRQLEPWREAVKDGAHGESANMPWLRVESVLLCRACSVSVRQIQINVTCVAASALGKGRIGSQCLCAYINYQS